MILTRGDPGEPATHRPADASVAPECHRHPASDRVATPRQRRQEHRTHRACRDPRARRRRGCRRCDRMRTGVIVMIASHRDLGQDHHGCARPRRRASPCARRRPRQRDLGAGHAALAGLSRETVLRATESGVEAQERRTTGRQSVRQHQQQRPGRVGGAAIACGRVYRAATPSPSTARRRRLAGRRHQALPAAPDLAGLARRGVLTHLDERATRQSAGCPRRRRPR